MKNAGLRIGSPIRLFKIARSLETDNWDAGVRQTVWNSQTTHRPSGWLAGSLPSVIVLCSVMIARVSKHD